MPCRSDVSTPGDALALLPVVAGPLGVAPNAPQKWQGHAGPEPSGKLGECLGREALFVNPSSGP